MSYSVFYIEPLDCHKCGKHVAKQDTGLSNSDFTVEVLDVDVCVGDKVLVDRPEFYDCFIPISDQAHYVSPVKLFEGWRCPYCGAAQWAVITLELVEGCNHTDEEYIFVSAESMELSLKVLEAVDFISKEADEWIGLEQDAENKIYQKVNSWVRNRFEELRSRGLGAVTRSLK